MRSQREPQTWEYLRGDLEPRKSLLTDLRNDNAGDEMQQAKSLVLRYLQSLPADETVSLPEMAEDLARKWPFHGKGQDYFRKAVAELRKEGWIKGAEGQLALDKIGCVVRRFLASKVSAPVSGL